MSGGRDVSGLPPTGFTDHERAADMDGSLTSGRRDEALRAERLLLYALNTDECHGVVTRDGAQEPCGKPTACVIDDPEGGPWAACVWHAHRYGTGRMVTLAQLRCGRGAVMIPARHSDAYDPAPDPRIPDAAELAREEDWHRAAVERRRSID